MKELTSMRLFKNRMKSGDRRGVSVVLILLLVVVALVISFCTIDMANLQRQHAQNQAVSDLGARYGANMTARTADTKRIQRFVDSIVKQNIRENTVFASDFSYDTEYGTVVPSTLEFVEGGVPLNSVRVQLDSKLRSLGFLTDPDKQHIVQRDATAASIHQDICVVVDRSSSMCFLDYVKKYPDYTLGNPLINLPNVPEKAVMKWWKHYAHPELTRWARLMDALDSMAEILSTSQQDELLSVVSYSHNHRIRYRDRFGKGQTFLIKAAIIEQEPTFEYTQTIDALKHKYNLNYPVYGWTNITAGMELGMDILTGPKSRTNAFKTLVVLTDGQYNRGAHPKITAAKAADKGIYVVCVTFGTGFSVKSMEDAAKAADGVHFHANTGVELEKIFQSIARMPIGAYLD